MSKGEKPKNTRSVDQIILSKKVSSSRVTPQTSTIEDHDDVNEILIIDELDGSKSSSEGDKCCECNYPIYTCCKDEFCEKEAVTLSHCPIDVKLKKSVNEEGIVANSTSNSTKEVQDKSLREASKHDDTLSTSSDDTSCQYNEETYTCCNKCLQCCNEDVVSFNQCPNEATYQLTALQHWSISEVESAVKDIEERLREITNSQRWVSIIDTL